MAVCYVYDTFLGCDSATTEARSVEISKTQVQ